MTYLGIYTKNVQPAGEWMKKIRYKYTMELYKEKTNQAICRKMSGTGR